MNGPVVVYGGRQLGKTALMRRARSRFHAPERGEYGVFFDAKDIADEAAFARAASKELAVSGLNIGEAASVRDLAEKLTYAFGRGQWTRLLLLVDESDALMSVFSRQNAESDSLKSLEDVRGKTDNSFKFVFAGLHNVFLVANAPNTIFGRLGTPLCIKPMSHADALSLLSRPLKYLGFSVNEGLLEKLLVNANFYPGVIHAVGAKIIELLTQKYADYYNVAKNPPYELCEKHIGAIMNSSDLANMINDRIRWTLEVDSSYLMLARCIAWLYYDDASMRRRGCQISEILECAALLGIDELCVMRRDKCAQLLSELCDMSILVQSEWTYRFRQVRFLPIVGKSSEDIERQIADAKAVTADA
jgi:hypothetical protein